MTYSTQTTKTGKTALVSSDGRTVHIYESELAAQTACDAMNRSLYEPVIDPYWQVNAGPCEVPVDGTRR